MAKKKNKTLREYRLEESITQHKRDWIKKYRAEKLEEYKAASTLEQRRDFIDLWRGGGISIAKAAEKIGICPHHAAEVLRRNTKKVTAVVLVERGKVR